MSDSIKHECGLAYIRLRKPIDYYYKKFGTSFIGLTKLYILMEKQHNRGQDGAGIAIQRIIKDANLNYLYRDREVGSSGLAKIYKKINNMIEDIKNQNPQSIANPDFLKGNLPFVGEILLGHLRYGTQGNNDVKFCHPFVKTDINNQKQITMAGNFNLVNTSELIEKYGNASCSEVTDSDLGAIVESVAASLAKHVDNNEDTYHLVSVLKNAFSQFDGGYLTCGLIGDGNSFVVRDANGIRPGYYYINEDFVVVASERPAIMTTFNTLFEEIIEIPPGHAIIIDRDGNPSIEKILEDRVVLPCSFERIYFSRGSDQEIYQERKNLGRFLSEKVLDHIDYNLKDTIFSFIPNTAETAFYGLIKGAEQYLNTKKFEKIKEIIAKDGDEEKIKEVINRRVRIEKIAIKDAKMRTFITQDGDRDEMVKHVYDVTYGTIKDHVDTIVVIDDSIVRGTTLKLSIIRMLDRLLPKKIIIVSSAPQIRYPDCYGIDMSKLNGFIAFQAAIELLKDLNKSHIIDEVYNLCKEAESNDSITKQNFVKAIYEPFTADEISDKISKMLKSDEVQADVDIIYQSIESLHEACPNHKGDWYFTGNYPTKGGNRVVNRAFINYYEGIDSRGY